MIDQIKPKEKGRKSYLRKEDIQILKEKVETNSLLLSSLTQDDLEKEIHDLARSRRFNTSYEKLCCKRTLATIIKNCNFITQPAAVKTASRVEAHGNIRNPISLCCLLNYLQMSVVRENYHSIDEVSILVDEMGDKPMV